MRRLFILLFVVFVGVFLADHSDVKQFRSVSKPLAVVADQSHREVYESPPAVSLGRGLSPKTIRWSASLAKALGPGGAVFIPVVQSPVAPAPTTTTTTTSAPPPPPRAPPVANPTDATSVSTSDWNCIRRWESSGGVGDGNYAEAGGGAYQFEDGTWQSTTGLQGPAENYSPAVQDAAALRLYSERGFEPWTTRWKCGLG